ncbi:MAG: M23 family metallopeptidase [Spirochaetaceae bacterium]|nr:M23 family metallopeptidase [Spirochaetaceae bacterium]
MMPIRFSTRYYFLTAFILTVLAVMASQPGLNARESMPTLDEEVDIAVEQPVLQPQIIYSESTDPAIRRSVEVSLRRGQTLSSLFVETGLSGQESFDITESLAAVMDMRRIKDGQKVKIFFDLDDVPSEVQLPVHYDKTVTALRSNRRWESRETVIEVNRIPTEASIIVASSLYQAAKDGGVPLSVMMDAIDLFSFDTDLQRDIHAGDRVQLIYERLTDDKGRLLAAGELLFARLETRKGQIDAWRYERMDGQIDYYEESGESVRKALLKTPVNGAYISSGFGFRQHPILGYTALHRGMDFAVRTGTPVMAAGEGTVVVAGWHDQYGNYVKIRHANHYDTIYAHFSSIARGIKVGMAINQGEVVGYVGSTGMSTGPHCHYEVLYYGSPVDPSELKFPPRHHLEGEDFQQFDLKRTAMASVYGL